MPKMLSEQHDPQLSEMLQISEKTTAKLCQFFGTLEFLVFCQTTTLCLIFDHISKQAAGGNKGEWCWIGAISFACKMLSSSIDV